MPKLLCVVAGFVIPIRTTSRLYLADRLAGYGVDTKSIPKACLQELADETVATAKSVAALSHRGWREIVTDHLDREAVNIAKILCGTFRDDLISQDYAERIKAILRRHGVSWAQA